jgi:hypothetical protein
MPTFALLPHQDLLPPGVLSDYLAQNRHSTQLNLKLSFLGCLLFEEPDPSGLAYTLVGGVATAPTGVGRVVVLFVF